MAERLFLHVGAPKSGTTYLQTVLWDNREALREQGLLVPGRRIFDHNRASLAVARASAPGGKEPQAQDAWRRLVREIARWPGDAVVSHEWFVLASAEGAQRTIAELAPAEVHIVFTARNFVQQVPAAWQETLKVGRGTPIADFVTGLDKKSGRWSWRNLDAARALPVWQVGDVTRDRVHVVTVPPSGGNPDLLLERFSSVCGFDPAACDTQGAVANESLGAEPARWLEMIGPDLRAAVDADDGHWTEQYRWIRNLVAHEVLVPLGGSRIALTDDVLEQLHARADESVEILRASGYDIVGDLDDLLDGRLRPGSRLPEEVEAAELLEPARALAVSLLQRLREETLRAERAEKRASRTARAEAPDQLTRRAAGRIRRVLGRG